MIYHGLTCSEMKLTPMNLRVLCGGEGFRFLLDLSLLGPRTASLGLNTSLSPSRILRTIYVLVTQVPTLQAFRFHQGN